MRHWLDQYANHHHRWHKSIEGGHVQFSRPFGLVEASFDCDGLYFEGRADINALLELEISTRMSTHQVQRHLLLAWTALRLCHVLLMAKGVERKSGDVGSGDASQRVFVVEAPSNAEEALRSAAADVVFVEDFYQDIDSADFYRHAQNSGRVVDSDRNLARVFVLPSTNHSGTKASLKILFVAGHQIWDGLTSYTWLNHFVKLLNTPSSELESIIAENSSPQSIQRRLPSAQEDLYPAISGSKAKQRWFWALNVVLRHVKTPQPAAFSNPLRRRTPLSSAQQFPSTYPDLFNYARVPPLNTFTVSANLGPKATKKLHRLCREAGTSIGAGGFVLVAIVMMSMYETEYPDVPLDSRLSFIGSFPINPRPFFKHAEAPDSLMLAFSDGVVLPFLPSYLSLEGRFRLLAKQAHRQLSRYQKRQKLQDATSKVDIGSRAPGRVIAMTYISVLERLRDKLPPHLKHTLNEKGPQGSLPLRPNPTMATCGVSSVGRSMWRRGVYDVNATLPEGDETIVADYRKTTQNVRAREGEFLVGIGGDDDGMGANVSYDGNVIDEELVKEWKRRMESLLEDDTRALL